MPEGSKKATSSAADATSGGISFGNVGDGGSGQNNLLVIGIVGLSIFGLLGLILIAKK